MAFPVVESTNESATVTAGTSHVVNLPAGIAAGDLLVVILNKGSAVASFTALAGWTEVVDEALANGMTVWARLADGTEGATVTFTSSAATRSAEVSFRISGAADPATLLPQLSTVATATSTAPNATTCTPTGGAKDYLWITFFGLAGEFADTDTLVTGWPTGYASNQLQKTCGTAGTNLGGLIACAARTANAASEDAGAFTSASSAAWRAYTLAVHPVPPPGAARLTQAVAEVVHTPAGVAGRLSQAAVEVLRTSWVIAPGLKFAHGSFLWAFAHGTGMTYTLDCV